MMLPEEKIRCLAVSYFGDAARDAIYADNYTGSLTALVAIRSLDSIGLFRDSAGQSIIVRIPFSVLGYMPKQAGHRKARWLPWWVRIRLAAVGSALIWWSGMHR